MTRPPAPLPGRRRTTAALVLTPDGAHALLARDDTFLPVPVTTAAPLGEDAATWAHGLLADLISAAGDDPLVAITVDVSQLLLAAVVDVRAPVPHVACIRVVPRASVEPELARSPSDVIERLVALRGTVPGGHDLFGTELHPLDLDVLDHVCGTVQQSGLDDVAIVAAGSQAGPQHERAVADALSRRMPGVHISVASDFGGQGLIAREATVVLNGAMRVRAEQVVDALEAARVEVAPGTQLRITRGDGGYSTPARVRAMPVVVVGATAALRLSGAAHLRGLPDCRVVLAPADRPHTREVGDVRRGLALVRPSRIDAIGTELVVPSAAIATLVGEPGDVGEGLDVPAVVATESDEYLAAVGALASRPTSWLDEVGFIESAEQLERVRRDAEERATAFATANGAVPGSGALVEASVVALPYSPSGTVRIRVRVAGDPDDAMPSGVGA